MGMLTEIVVGAILVFGVFVFSNMALVRQIAAYNVFQMEMEANVLDLEARMAAHSAFQTEMEARFAATSELHRVTLRDILASEVG